MFILFFLFNKEDILFNYEFFKNLYYIFLAVTSNQRSWKLRILAVTSNQRSWKLRIKKLS